MPTVKCPSCGALNDTDNAIPYCEECGKRLPRSSAFRSDAPARPAASSGIREDEPDVRSPRWSDRDDQGDYPDVRHRGERTPAQKKAAQGVASVLFIIAALQLICGSIALFAAPEQLGVQPGQPVALVIVGGILLFMAVLYAGLGVWALFMPVVAGIVGVVIYVGLALLDIAAAPDMAYRGIIVKILFTIALIRAIVTANNANRDATRD
jgi:hypothetical protein